MKKLFLSILFSVMLLSRVFAVPEVVKNIPDLKQGVAYSLLEDEVVYLSTTKIAEFKKIDLEFGYASTDKIVGVVSIGLLDFKDYITLPILDLLELNIGVYGGYGRLSGDNEFDYGISATILNIKF